MHADIGAEKLRLDMGVGAAVLAGNFVLRVNLVGIIPTGLAILYNLSLWRQFIEFRSRIPHKLRTLVIFMAVDHGRAGAGRLRRYSCIVLALDSHFDV